MRSQGKGRVGSEQDPGSREGGVGWAWLELGCEHSGACAGLSLSTGGLWSHPMVQLQPHLSVRRSRQHLQQSSGTAGRGSESLRAGAPTLHPGGRCCVVPHPSEQGHRWAGFQEPQGWSPHPTPLRRVLCGPPPF